LALKQSPFSRTPPTDIPVIPGFNAPAGAAGQVPAAKILSPVHKHDGMESNPIVLFSYSIGRGRRVFNGLSCTLCDVNLCGYMLQTFVPVCVDVVEVCLSPKKQKKKNHDIELGNLLITPVLFRFRSVPPTNVVVAHCIITKIPGRLQKTTKKFTHQKFRKTQQQMRCPTLLRSLSRWPVGLGSCHSSAWSTESHRYQL
jgi:hypothetical protein